MEKWYWIELIGFDNTQKDYGVGDFLSRTEGKVNGVSLLFSNLSFVLDHENTQTQTPLAQCHCSYGGYLHGDERDRQAWTNFQLRALVQELQKNNVKVAASFFDYFAYTTDDGERVESAFVSKHKEVVYLNRNGENGHTVCLLKRLNSGEYFDEIFAEKLKQTVAFYGFDGVQIGDGLSSFRPSIQNGDMGDDLVAQFKADTGIDDKKLVAVAASVTAYKRRRKYIIDHLYLQWIQWCADRWARCYEKIYKAFENTNVALYFNSVWTRDPFEAYVRYGIDYQTTMYKADGIMVEWATAANINSVGDNGGVYLPPEKRVDYLYQFALAHQSIKAYCPNVLQYTMSAIKDTYEQWNLMGVAPMELESSFFFRNQGYAFTGTEYQPVSQGPWYCLSSGIQRGEWQKLHALEGVSRVESVQKPLGFVLVVGTDTRTEAARYLQTFDYGRSQLSYELFSSGLCLCAMVRAEHIQNVDAPLLILSPDTLTEKELACVEASGRPMVIVGTKNTVSGAIQVYQGKYISVWMKNMSTNGMDFSILAKCDTPKACKKSMHLPFRGLWTCPLPYNSLPKTFFKALSKLLNEAFDVPRLVSRRCNGGIVGWQVDDNKYRVAIFNATHTYYNSEVRMPFAVKKAAAVNKSGNHKVAVFGNILCEKVSPRGTSILEIERK